MLHLIITALLALGLVFFFGATLGLVRLPDFYTRMHAAGKGDTLSSILLLLALALANLERHHDFATVLVSVKIMAIALFIFIASPTATHAIMDAGYEKGISPWKKDLDREEGK